MKVGHKNFIKIADHVNIDHISGMQEYQQDRRPREYQQEVISARQYESRPQEFHQDRRPCEYRSYNWDARISARS
jgi:hypothetical protein